MKVQRSAVYIFEVCPAFLLAVMVMVAIVTVLVFLLAVCSAGSEEFDAFVRNHSFVFISGWPQSGTSFVHQIFTMHPQMSTMVEKCESILGKRCLNWNHEGQWLIPGKSRAVLNSGVLCPHDGNVTSDEQRLILSEWERYWSLEQIFLVEKSPHSFLKIPLLRTLFRNALSVKFIVLLKHPVTLNVATPKGYSWATHSEKIPSSSSSTAAALTRSASPAQTPLRPGEKETVAKFFLDMMRHDNSTLFPHRSPRCSMGWVPAMRSLRAMLGSDPLSRRDVKIVRFESFQSPLGVCRRLFAFALGSTGSSLAQQALLQGSIDEICDRHFSSSAMASTSKVGLPGQGLGRPLLLPGAMGRGAAAIGRSSGASMGHKAQSVGAATRGGRSPDGKRHLVGTPPPGTSGNNSDVLDRVSVRRQSRQLRLRSSQEVASDSFHFIPALVGERGRARVADYLAVYRVLSPALRAQLDAVNAELRQFGYDLTQWQARQVGASIFREWEL